MRVAAEESVRADDGASLWTAASGVGPGLVLCHGGPGMHDYLGPVAEMVDDLFRVHRWDQRGAGRSAHVGPYTLARFVADVDAIRAHFSYERWIVGGHSWGATLALHYAFSYPERVDAVIYMNGTGLAWSRWRQAFREQRRSRFSAKQSERFHYLEAKVDAGELNDPAQLREFHILNDVPNFGDRDRALELAQSDVDEILRHPINYDANGALSGEVNALAEDELARCCARLTVPVLIVDGEQDPRPIAAVDSLARALPAVERVVLEGVGHLPWLEAPDALRGALRSFVAQRLPRARRG